MLTEGMFVGDRYEIVNKIGTGGMSDVYKAKDHTLGRFVAIKVLKPEFFGGCQFCDKVPHGSPVGGRIRTSEYCKHL